MPSLREIEDFVFRAEIENVKEECGFETDEEALAFYEKYKKEIRPKIFGKTEKPKKTVHNCSECDYCYSYEKSEKIENIYSTVVNQNREALNGL